MKKLRVRAMGSGSRRILTVADPLLSCWEMLEPVSSSDSMNKRAFLRPAITMQT